MFAPVIIWHLACLDVRHSPWTCFFCVELVSALQHSTRSYTGGRDYRVRWRLHTPTNRRLHLHEEFRVQYLPSTVRHAACRGWIGIPALACQSPGDCFIPPVPGGPQCPIFLPNKQHASRDVKVSPVFSPSLWSRLKYLNTYCMHSPQY